MIFIWPHWAAFKILVPRPVMGPMLPAEEARSLPWTAKECQAMSLWKLVWQLLGSRPFGKIEGWVVRTIDKVSLSPPHPSTILWQLLCPNSWSSFFIWTYYWIWFFARLPTTECNSCSGHLGKVPGTTQPSPPSPSLPHTPKAISFIQNRVLKSCISMTPITQIKTKRFSRIQICKNIWIFD